MSRAYHTEDQKLVSLANVENWSWDDCFEIRNILEDKGYSVNCVLRIGADGEFHDALEVDRVDAPRLVEQLFRQRLVAEFQGEGHWKAAIIFSHDYPAETIIRKVGRFQKNKEE